MRTVKITIELEVAAQDHITNDLLAKPVLYYNLACDRNAADASEFSSFSFGAVICKQKVAIEPVSK